MIARSAPESASIAVRVYIHHRVLTQLLQMSLHPLSRTKQARLFPIPQAVDDRALWLPALLQQLAQSASFFEHGRGSRNGIVGSIDPRVVVIPTDHPLIRICGTGNARNDV